MTILVRERMPLRLHATVATPAGLQKRWAPDEPRPENTLSELVFSDTMPGGCEQASSSLARKILADCPDLEEFSRVDIRGVGGEIAWQGRLDASPRSWGDQSSIQPQLVGYQSHLDDNTAARIIYVNADRSAWQSPSVQRQINEIGAGIDMDDPSSAQDDTTGYPSVITGVQGPNIRAKTCEAWFDANGIPIGGLYYAWKLDGNIDPADTNWSWIARLLTDDIATSGDATSELRAAGPGSGTLAATAGNRDWARVRLSYGAALPSSTAFQVFWTCLAVYGNHGLALQGAGDFQNAPGLLASDIIAHAVGTWAPLLSFTTGPNGTIVPSDFVIPHLTFPDPTTAGEIVKGASAFDLQDWAVWPSPTGPVFWWYPRGTYGRNWRARVGPSQLQETGPTSARVYNGVIVTFNDPSGAGRSVGPPGSGCNIEDSSLQDQDPQNPATQAGLDHWSPPLAMGTATSDAAIKIGQAFLQEQKLLDTSGQATLVGHVEDDRGVLWPAWKVRSGDTITFVDASDPSPRRIVRKEWSDSSKSATVSLDAPPEGMTQLLARLGVELAPLGIS